MDSQVPDEERQSQLCPAVFNLSEMSSVLLFQSKSLSITLKDVADVIWQPGAVQHTREASRSGQSSSVKTHP